MHIFEDSVISMGIFQLPMGASIPLHDHPGMTVISRCALIMRLTRQRSAVSCDLLLCALVEWGSRRAFRPHVNKFVRRRMNVSYMCRVLYGSLHLRAYDWVNDKPANMGARGYAREARDQVKHLACFAG